MRNVIDRQRLYVPAWDGNLDKPEAERIRVTLRYPGFLDMAVLAKPSVAAITALIVFSREKIDAQTILMADMSRTTTDVLRTAEWAKKQKVDKAPVPENNELLRQVLEFSTSYVKTLVPDIEGIPGIKTGEDLVSGPSFLVGLIFDLALELWHSHALPEEKKTT